MSIEKLGVRENLSGRAFNICKYNDLTSLKAIQNHYKIHGTFKNIRNCGNKVNTELLFVVAKYQSKSLNSIVRKEPTFEPSELKIKSLINEMLVQNFQVNPQLLIKIAAENDLNKGLTIFYTINLLIKEGLFFNEQKRYVFENNIDIFKNYKLVSTVASAAHLGISIERIRQIRNRAYYNFLQKTALFRDLPHECINLYDLKSEIPLNVVRLELLKEIAEKEGVKYNTDFMNLVFHIILGEEYTLIGQIQDKLFHRHALGVYFWRNTYLIAKNLNDCCDFSKCVSDIHKMKRAKVLKTYSINLHSFLKSYKRITNPKLQIQFLDTATYIVSKEFPDNFNAPNKIVIYRNTIKTLPEYIYEIFYDINKPTSLSELTEKLNSKYPDKTFNINSIKASCVKDPRFISMGHTKVYALKEWEERSDYFKGGSLRKISEEYLSTQSSPVHFDELINHIRKYRKNILRGSLWTNLKLAGSSRFVFYPGDKIGLPLKKQ